MGGETRSWSIIEARMQRCPVGCFSSRLKTQGKREFQYGRFEARVKLPYGQGIWPAFWTLGYDIDTVSWPASGEIDIVEMVGGGSGGDSSELRDDSIVSSVHYK